MSEAEKKPAADPATNPSYASVLKYMTYSLSVPERALRSSASLVGGAVRETATLLVPQAFQSSKTYTVMVQQMLDFVVEDIGGVERKATDEESTVVENFVARKTVGNFVEMAGLATMHVSPLTVLAVLSDVAYGSQTFLREWGEELKQQGIIDEHSTINHVDDLLASVAAASSTTATAFDTPPLSVDGLRQTIEETRRSVAGIDPTKVIPQAELERMWREMHTLATREGVTLVELSTTMTLHSLGRVGKLGSGALSGVRVAGSIFDQHVIDHYRTALGDINRDGVYATLALSSAPYIGAVWQNFSSQKTTVTQDLLNGKLVGRTWSGVRRWMGISDEAAAEVLPPQPSAADLPATDSEPPMA